VSQQPTRGGRGGGPNLDVIQRKGRLRKADSSSVVADFTGRGVTVGGDVVQELRPEQAAQEFVQLHSAPAIEAEPVQQQPVQSPVSAQEVPQAPVQQPVQAPVQAAVQAAPAAVDEPRAQAPAKKPAKDAGVKVGFYQPRDAGEQMRAAFLATRHITKYKTLSDFICSVLEAEVHRLQTEYNNGEPFESEPDSIPRGRPVG
jgi:hypothetical protein